MKNKIIRISSLILSILGVILAFIETYLNEPILSAICLICYVICLAIYERTK